MVASRIVRGFDLQKEGEFSEDEIASNKEFYQKTLGHVHVGLNFWVDHGPDTLRRFRLFSDNATPNQYESNRRLHSFAYLPFYAMIGYGVGVRYLLHTRQKMGLTKAQIEEGIAIAFLVCGPAGMEVIARALEDFDWTDPEEPAVFPEGFAVDNDAFLSGLDFSEEDMLPGEQEKLEQWYLDVLGEVPPYVPFLGRQRPRMLKAMRNRWEHCIVTLPKQVMPLTLLHFEITRGNVPGIRENLLLARAWGVSKELALTVMGSALINGWTSGGTLIAEAGEDILDNWDR